LKKAVSNRSRMVLRWAAYCWAVALARLARALARPEVVPASNINQRSVNPIDQS
jgi:hypothetical protein